jgi:hypothetical protein
VNERCPSSPPASARIESARFVLEMNVINQEEQIKEPKIERRERVKLSAKESLQRMQEFSKRKENLLAAVGQGKNRSSSA